MLMLAQARALKVGIVSKKIYRLKTSSGKGWKWKKRRKRRVELTFARRKPLTAVGWK